MNPMYCKYSNDRDKKFQIKTTIEEQGDRKEVHKAAMTEEAVPHIQHMHQVYERMAEAYRDTKLEPNCCRLEERETCFEFVTGETLEHRLDELYFEGKYYEVIEFIKAYADLLYNLPGNQPFKVTDGFREVFGDSTFDSSTKSLAVSNIDLIFGNIMECGDKWVVIDYEWTFDFPVPVEFILYRALYYYIHGTTKRNELISFQIFKIMGITDEARRKYEQMEYAFQQYVAGTNVTLSRLKQLMLKRNIPAHQAGSEDYIQIYYKREGVISEEDSVVRYYDGIHMDMTLPVTPDVEQLRIDPSAHAALVEIEIEELEDRAISLGENVVELGEHLYLFLADDPNFMVNLEGVSERELHIHVRKASMDNALAQELYQLKEDILAAEVQKDRLLAEKQALEVQMQQAQQAQQQELQVQQQTQADMEAYQQELQTHIANQDAHINVLQAELHKYGSYVNNLHSKPVWRVMSATKKTAKSVKNEGVVETTKKVYRKVKNKVKSKVNSGDTAVAVQQQAAVGNKAAVDKTKKRILVVVHESQKAGATLVSLSIVKTLRRITDYEPVVLLIAGGPLTEEFKKYAIVYEMNQPDFSQVYDEAALNAYVDEIHQMGVRYAICNSVVTGIVLPALKKRNIKAITMVHELQTSIVNYNFVQAAQNVAKLSEDVVFAAEFVKKQFVENYPVKEEHCHIIPQGIYATFNTLRLEDKMQNKTKLCKELNIPEESRIVLGYGYGNFRKGLDWFGVVAAEAIQRDENIHFLWLGDCDPEFKCWIENDLQKAEIQKNFHWIGYTENPGYICGGADAYLLISREDPFPSAALEEMKQFTPVIAFEGAGGIPEILAEDRGMVVPYGDCHACVEAIFELMNDSEKYERIVKNAKEYADTLTPENYLTSILNILTDHGVAFKELSKKKVSVVIPNYNYETYIPERLACILNQTIKPYEIIFLDDVSKDNSVAVAREILEASGIKHQIIANEVNNGCFRQWLKGIEHATGDYIWIAEADDACEYDFLERLLPFFEDDQVNLAYAQSEIIDEHGTHTHYVYTEYTKDLDPEKWNRDYVNNGECEIIDGLGIKNTIPNASGVLFRKSALEGLDEKLKEYAISGDWYAYVYAVKTGKIAFCSTVLNYHRRHSSSIIHKREQDIKLFVELMNIKLYIAENFLIPQNIRERFVNHVRNEYGRLMAENSLPFEQQETLMAIQNQLEATVQDKIEQYAFLQNQPKKNILYVIPDFEMGGGQTLVVRLANYFSRFHNVYLYNARPWLSEERIVNMIADKVTVLDSNGTPEQLRGYILQNHIQIINNHIWWSDKIVYQAAHDLNVKIVLSMHGCYEALVEHPDWDKDFDVLVPEILGRANEIIYATDKNKKIFERVPVLEKTHQIYYGYELESIPRKDKQELNMQQDAFIFGMVARGIKPKGFGEAVEAFKQIQEELGTNTHLVLIGNGEFIDTLKEANTGNEQIHFVDYLKKPSEWIGWVKNFDVALLPTYFISESLPNSVIEYLAYDVPVITTNIGDIRYMIKDETHEAGIVLELHDGMVDVEELAAAMKKMYQDKEAYAAYKADTTAMFSQFDMKNFANNYYDLYK